VPLTVANNNNFNAFRISALYTIVSRLGWIIFVSSLALAFSASLLMSQRGFTKVFVSGITDVTELWGDDIFWS